MKRTRKKSFRFSEKREFILRFLSKAGIIGAEILINMLLTIPQASIAMMCSGSKSGSLSNLDSLSMSSYKVDFRSRRAIYDLLDRLSRDGLIESRSGNIQIVRRGLTYLSHFMRLPPWGKKYPAKKSRSVTLVVFDIPEKERATRDWLRDALRRLQFVPLQQSVWIGKMGIPLDFVHDIEQYDIQRYIHILKVHKQGSVSAVLKNILPKIHPLANSRP
jgi:hypothetical protein